MKSINLIPLSRRQAKSRRGYVQRWAVAVVIYGALSLTVGVMCFAVSSSQDPLVAQELDAVYIQINDLDTTIAQVKTNLLETQASLDASLVMVNQPDWSILLATLSNMLGDGIVLRHCQLTSSTMPPPTGRGVNTDKDGPDQLTHFVLELAGVGRSQNDVSRFVLRLEQSQLFDEVILVETDQEQFLSKPAIGFRLRCVLSGSSGAQK